ncbi:PIG-L family deacetylase [Agrococcus sp. ARC_14]|uniref:PIG-L family deacetylase n=1 Tax=Agrococcus sp. ARC_14 TaxID=2919927 RepID=UPI001F064E8D|nr:PIG-L family deacetylase [Agrococcus sp. ARC_14]MCH1882598.1 PIG-L family deacetylase [Agrococcus sp. ARC_14]
MDPRLERVMFVHAHPDDETLSTGAAIAAVAAAGGDAVVVTFTLGERGEVRSERQGAADEIGIGEVRRAELEAALRALGARGRRIHGWDDSGMAWHRSGKAAAAPDAPPTSMSRADIDDLADALGVAVEEIDPTAIVTYDADGGYGHPDHVAAHAAAVIVARRYDLPLYVRTDRPADVTFALEPVRAQVLAALAQHRSQLTVEGDDVLHVGGQRRAIDTVEHYRLIEARPARRTRWLLLVGGLLAGVVVGTVGTFSHQQLPWGLGLSLIAAVGLIVGIRAASGSRPMTLAAVIGLIGVIAIIAIDPLGRGAWGTERSLVPSNLAGWLWSLIPALASLIALAWPDAEAMRRIRMAAKPGTEGEADR